VSLVASDRSLYAVPALWFLLAVMAAQLQTLLVVMGIAAGLVGFAVGSAYLDGDEPDTASVELALVAGSMALVTTWWWLARYTAVANPYGHPRNAISLLVGIAVVAVPVRTGRRRPRAALVGYGAALVALPFVIGGIGTDALPGCAPGGGWSIDGLAFRLFEVVPSEYRVEDVHLSTLTVEWYDGCIPRDGPLSLSVLGALAVAVGARGSRS
jgi:hypothetical protein